MPRSLLTTCSSGRFQGVLRRVRGVFNANSLVLRNIATPLASRLQLLEAWVSKVVLWNPTAESSLIGTLRNARGSAVWWRGRRLLPSLSLYIFIYLSNYIYGPHDVHTTAYLNDISQYHVTGGPPSYSTEYHSWCKTMSRLTNLTFRWKDICRRIYDVSGAST